MLSQKPARLQSSIFVYPTRDTWMTLYCFLSWCVAQEHFNGKVGVQVNISWGFFCFTYTFVECVHFELICRGETVLAIYGQCTVFELTNWLLETSHSFLNWTSGQMYLWGFFRSIIALTCPFPLNALSHLQKASKISPIRRIWIYPLCWWGASFCHVPKSNVVSPTIFTWYKRIKAM